MLYFNRRVASVRCDRMTNDVQTANAFASSWNNLPAGSIYTRAQVEDWFAPITEKEVRGKRVLELGCGNGSLMLHLAAWQPAFLEGIDLGRSVVSAEHNMRQTGFDTYKITQADLTTVRDSDADLVYSIGVLHHLHDPEAGFQAVVANVKPGGQFHCWVYAKEGNGIVRCAVDPLRRFCSRLPWWLTKYFVATPLAVPFYVYAKTLRLLRQARWLRRVPLRDYCLWIAQREFAFFRHVAFDQLVTPQTTYLDRSTIARWLNHPKILPGSTYIIFRNSNSWKFGGTVRPDATPSS
jgi:SAM-dependent methyltransferase